MGSIVPVQNSDSYMTMIFLLGNDRNRLIDKYGSNFFLSAVLWEGQVIELAFRCIIRILGQANQSKKVWTNFSNSGRYYTYRTLESANQIGACQFEYMTRGQFHETKLRF